MSRDFLLFRSVIGLMIMNSHLGFAQGNKEAIDTLTAVSQKMEIPIIVKFSGENQENIQKMNALPSEYHAYVQKYHYKLKKNSATHLANDEYDVWVVSVENSQWERDHNSVHGVSVPGFPVFYLFVRDSNHQFLAWVDSTELL